MEKKVKKVQKTLDEDGYRNGAQHGDYDDDGDDRERSARSDYKEKEDFIFYRSFSPSLCQKY